MDPSVAFTASNLTSHEFMEIVRAKALEEFSDPQRVVSLPPRERDTDSKVVDRDSVALQSLFPRPRPQVGGTQQEDWGFSMLQIRDVHAAHGCRGSGVRVAVLDTGVSKQHEDLASAIETGADFSGGWTGWEDFQGHGTHCAGIIGARDNDRGIIGVAPECTLLIGKVLGDSGSGTLEGIAAGIDWAVSQRADVISMSLGADGPISGNIRAAIDRAIAAGCLISVAAGNSGPYPGTVGNPGNYNPCIAVGAVDSSSRVAEFSSRGVEVDVSAPGVQILSCFPGNRYTKMSGTSMACPYVSGVLALYVEKCRKVGRVPSQPEAEALLRSTALDIDIPGFDINTGYGLIQPMALLNALDPVVPPPVPPPIDLPVPPPINPPIPPPVPSPVPPVPPRPVSYTLVFRGVELIPEQ